MGEWRGKSVDKWDCLCYIGAEHEGGTMKVKDMILKEALEEKRVETAHAIEEFAGEAPA